MFIKQIINKLFRIDGRFYLGPGDYFNVNYLIANNMLAPNEILRGHYFDLNSPADYPDFYYQLLRWSQVNTGRNAPRYYKIKF